MVLEYSSQGLSVGGRICLIRQLNIKTQNQCTVNIWGSDLYNGYNTKKRACGPHENSNDTHIWGCFRILSLYFEYIIAEVFEVTADTKEKTLILCVILLYIYILFDS